jgi:RNA polymerase sigma-70 factor (ECF subfamily)
VLTLGEALNGQPDSGSGESLDTILDRAALGDRGAFAELYTAHAPDVTRLCRRMLDSSEDAEDARNEVFMRAQQAFATYQRGRPFRSWLLAVAAHHCVDRLRRRHAERRLFEPSELEEEGLPGRGPSPLRAVLAREQTDLLTTALDAMPARFRAVLAMRYFAELSYAEIAEAADIRVEHVGVLLFRGKARLREALAGKGERQ